MAEQNETVDVDKLEGLLAKLVKAADATDLRKGGIENSGTVGSGGKQGGGQGSWSDSGTLDSMMIAKMEAAGLPSGLIAAFSAFMSGAKKDKDGKDCCPPAFKSEPQGNLAKSFRDQLGDQLGDDQQMVDISPYLDGLTTAVGDRIDALTKSMLGSQQSQAGVNKALAAAVSQIGNLVKSQAKVINHLGAKLGVLEHAPVPVQRGVTGTAQPLNKAMPGETGAPSEQLNKSEVLSTLSYMNLEKGMREIGGRRTFELIGLLEGGGVYDQETHSAVTNFLKGCSPSEQNLAKSYH